MIFRIMFGMKTLRMFLVEVRMLITVSQIRTKVRIPIVCLIRRKNSVMSVNLGMKNPQCFGILVPAPPVTKLADQPCRIAGPDATRRGIRAYESKSKHGCPKEFGLPAKAV